MLSVYGTPRGFVNPLLFRLHKAPRDFAKFPCVGASWSTFHICRKKDWNVWISVCTRSLYRAGFVHTYIHTYSHYSLFSHWQLVALVTSRARTVDLWSSEVYALVDNIRTKALNFLLCKYLHVYENNYFQVTLLFSYTVCKVMEYL